MTHTSSFAVHLACQPDSDIDYVTCQSAVVSVRQHNEILATALVQKIDTHGQLLELCFNFEDLTAPVELIIETHTDHDQFNKDNPIAVTQLICDDLFTIPHWTMLGKLMHNNQLLDIGNVLWQSGQLTYTFVLPHCSMREHVI